jgi:hypothetical protein
VARNLKRLWHALKGDAIDADRWVEAEATESTATLRHMGILATITGGDIQNVARWAAQSRREQLGWKWDYQARREHLNLASEWQEEDEDPGK